MITGRSILNKRASSATTNRLPRANSAGNKSEADAFIAYHQLESYQRQLNESQEQLRCFIQLVRNAWLGDEMAIKHVTRVIGVAPPNIQPIISNQQLIDWKVQPQAPVVNNWTKLSVGLLNKESESRIGAKQLEQNQYLAQREAYLDGLMAQNRFATDSTVCLVPPPTNRFEQVEPSLTHNNMGAYKNKKNIERKPPNGGKKPALVASGMKESVVAPTQQTKFADNIENLCLRPLNPADGDTGFLGMTSTTVHTSEVHTQLSYNDPERYNQGNLFDPESVINSVIGKQSLSRPSSGTQRRVGSSQQRPVIGAQRPSTSTQRLKYRPGSAAKPRLDLTDHIPDLSFPNVSRRTSLDSEPPDVNSDVLFEDARHVTFDHGQSGSENSSSPKIRQKSLSGDSKKKHVGDSFIESEMQMLHLEDEFKDSVVALQKKIGVSDSGLVW